MDTFPKLKIIIGSVNERDARVKTKAVFISSNSGKKWNTLIKKSWVYIIHKTAKKLKWRDTS